jgi:hypothetical protein
MGESNAKMVPKIHPRSRLSDTAEILQFTSQNLTYLGLDCPTVA